MIRDASVLKLTTVQVEPEIFDRLGGYFFPPTIVPGTFLYLAGNCARKLKVTQRC